MVSNQQKSNPKSWVQTYADYLYAYAKQRVGDEEWARDLVQETFLAALESASKFEGKSSERTWLTAILKHKLSNSYRQKARLSVVRVNGDFEETDFFDPNLNNWKKEHWPALLGVEQHDPLHNKELKAILKSCIEKLPPLWLAAFTRKHVDEESTADICSELKVSDSNFWVIMHRAKLNLRSCIQKRWF